MYGNGYSMAIVLDHRSTALTETENGECYKAQPNWDLLRTVTFPSICIHVCVCNQGACTDNLVDVVDPLLIFQNF